MNGTADIFNEHFFYFFHHPILEYNETETLSANDSYTFLHPCKRLFLKYTDYKTYTIYREIWIIVFLKKCLINKKLENKK